MEDSRATGDLVRVKVQREWEKLKRQGWSVKEGKWFATIAGVSRRATLPPFTEAQGARKRKVDGIAPVSGAGMLGEVAALKELIKEREPKL